MAAAGAGAGAEAEAGAAGGEEEEADAPVQCVRLTDPPVAHGLRGGRPHEVFVELLRRSGAVIGWTTSPPDMGQPLPNIQFMVPFEAASHDGLAHAQEHIIADSFEDALRAGETLLVRSGVKRDAETLEHFIRFGFYAASEAGLVKALPLIVRLLLEPPGNASLVWDETGRLSAAGEASSPFGHEIADAEGEELTVVDAALDEGAFDGLPCAYYSGGRLSVIQGSVEPEGVLTKARLDAFHAAFFRPSNFRVLCVDISDKAAVLEALVEGLGEREGGPLDCPVGIWDRRPQIQPLQAPTFKSHNFGAPASATTTLALVWRVGTAGRLLETMRLSAALKTLLPAFDAALGRAADNRVRKSGPTQGRVRAVGGLLRASVQISVRPAGDLHLDDALLRTLCASMETALRAARTEVAANAEANFGAAAQGTVAKSLCKVGADPRGSLVESVSQLLAGLRFDNLNFEQERREFTQVLTQTIEADVIAQVVAGDADRQSWNLVLDRLAPVAWHMSHVAVRPEPQRAAQLSADAAAAAGQLSEAQQEARAELGRVSAAERAAADGAGLPAALLARYPEAPPLEPVKEGLAFQRAAPSHAYRGRDVKEPSVAGPLQPFSRELPPPPLMAFAATGASTIALATFSYLQAPTLDDARGANVWEGLLRAQLHIHPGDDEAVATNETLDGALGVWAGLGLEGEGPVDDVVGLLLVVPAEDFPAAARCLAKLSSPRAVWTDRSLEQLLDVWADVECGSPVGACSELCRLMAAKAGCPASLRSAGGLWRAAVVAESRASEGGRVAVLGRLRGLLDRVCGRIQNPIQQFHLVSGGLDRYSRSKGKAAYESAVRAMGGERGERRDWFTDAPLPYDPVLHREDSPSGNAVLALHNALRSSFAKVAMLKPSVRQQAALGLFGELVCRCHCSALFRLRQAGAYYTPFARVDSDGFWIGWVSGGDPARVWQAVKQLLNEVLEVPWNGNGRNLLEEARQSFLVSLVQRYDDTRYPGVARAVQAYRHGDPMDSDSYLTPLTEEATELLDENAVKDVCRPVIGRLSQRGPVPGVYSAAAVPFANAQAVQRSLHEVLGGEVPRLLDITSDFLR